MTPKVLTHEQDCGSLILFKFRLQNTQICPSTNWSICGRTNHLSIHKSDIVNFRQIICNTTNHLLKDKFLRPAGDSVLLSIENTNLHVLSLKFGRNI